MKDYVKYIKVGDAVKILCNDCIRYVFPTTAEPTTEFIKLNNAINLLRLYPSADVASKWIPCDERLPEPNLAVLGYAPKFDNIFAVYYDSVCGWITWNPVHDEPFPSFQGEIVAWMPFPKPYKGERRDDETN